MEEMKVRVSISLFPASTDEEDVKYMVLVPY